MAEQAELGQLGDKADVEDPFVEVFVDLGHITVFDSAADGIARIPLLVVQQMFAVVTVDALEPLHKIHPSLLTKTGSGGGILVLRGAPRPHHGPHTKRFQGRGTTSSAASKGLSSPGTRSLAGSEFH